MWQGMADSGRIGRVWRLGAGSPKRVEPGGRTLVGRHASNGHSLAESLGVQPANDGTRRLKCEYGQEPFFKRAHARPGRRGRSPATCEDRGLKTRPETAAHVLQILLAARLGSRHSAKTRRQMSETHLKRNAALRRAKSVEYR